MITLKKVLVATDFGETSEAALIYGRTLARTFGASLTLLHAAEDVLARGFDGYLGVPDLQTDVERSARKRLEALIGDDDRRELRATGVVLTSNNTAIEIARYAQEHQIDLIVMGTHGRKGFEHMLLGSVAEKVVRIAPCPVLTVHHPEHEFLIPDAIEVMAHA